MYADANLIRKDVNPWLKVLMASGPTFCKRPQMGTFDNDEEEDGEDSCVEETAIDDSSSCSWPQKGDTTTVRRGKSCQIRGKHTITLDPKKNTKAEEFQPVETT